MKHSALAGVVAGLATMALAAPAFGDAPAGLTNHFQPEVFTCGARSVIVIAANGRTGYLDGVHYIANEFHGRFTFDPSDPAEETQTDSFDKVWPDYSGSGTEVTCTATFSDTDETGTFSGTFTVVAEPLRR